MSRILVAMSGGVDSSVTAAMLKEEGHEVIGGFMQIFDYSKECDTSFGSCCSPQDCADARRVAEKINIPFYTFNMEDVFKTKVIDYFISEYLSGRTPNPCIYCNSSLKFDYLLKKAASFGADYVATGHYAIIEQENKPALKRGVDHTKDQSYFLFNLTQKQLEHTLFPLGRYTKKEIREKARQFEIPVAEKKDSQEICFIEDNNYSKFIDENIGERKIINGFLKDQNGKVLKEHDGIHKFTIGQRKHIGVAMGYPAYITNIDPKTGDVFVGTKDQLFKNKMMVDNIVLTNGKESVNETIQAEIQIRYRSTAKPGTITFLENSRAEILFDEPVMSITPGQAAVFYHKDTVFGGGWIV